MSAQVTPGASGRPAPILVGLAFTVSGFTSLVLEVVWSKALAQLLGSTLHSVSTVVAAYLGGLALGAWLVRAGRAPRAAAAPSLRLARGRHRPLRARLSRRSFTLSIHWWARPTAALGPASPAYLAMRVVLARGARARATDRAHGRHAAGARGRGPDAGGEFGASLGRLYGLNTVGAVAGAALAGFRLIPALGLTGTTRCRGPGSARGRRRHGVPGQPRRGAAHAATGSRGGARLGAERQRVRAGSPSSLFGLSGAVALVLEITWARMFSLVFGSSVYSFALVLASYLLALRARQPVVGRAARRRRARGAPSPCSRSAPPRAPPSACGRCPTCRACSWPCCSSAGRT